MGGVIKSVGSFVSGAVNTVKNVAEKVAPVLDVVSAIPGVGQLAGFAKSALSVVTNIDKVFSNFPMGALQVAATAALKSLPMPVSQIANWLQEHGKPLLTALAPTGCFQFLPKAIEAKLPDGMDAILAGFEQAKSARA